MKQRPGDAGPIRKEVVEEPDLVAHRKESDRAAPTIHLQSRIETTQRRCGASIDSEWSIRSSVGPTCQLAFMTEDTPETLSMAADGVVFRPPRVSDAAEVWQLSRDSGALDENSPYAYLLLCSHFAATSTVAEENGKIVGFASCYRPPTHPQAVFVWQIAVDVALRGRGLGKKLLSAALAQPANRDARFVEATVTESNDASQRLFRSLAAERGTACEVSVEYPPEAFPDGNHEAELLFRIGPLQSDMHYPSAPGSTGRMARTTTRIS